MQERVVAALAHPQDASDENLMGFRFKVWGSRFEGYGLLGFKLWQDASSADVPQEATFSNRF